MTSPIAIDAFHTEAIDCELLAAQGYVIVPDFLAPKYARTLYDYAAALPAYEWHTAGIGRATNFTTDTQVRGDQIRWLQRQQPTEFSYLELMEKLRLQLNRELFMGLFDYECHLAYYAPGAFYKKHVDAFKGRSNRILSSVFYLNHDWQQADGGELVIYGKQGQVLETILPEAGKLVLFLSDVFVHEVRRGARSRYSITGWFRHNNSIGGVIDPTR